MKIALSKAVFQLKPNSKTFNAQVVVVTWIHHLHKHDTIMQVRNPGETTDWNVCGDHNIPGYDWNIEDANLDTPSHILQGLCIRV